LRVVRVLSSALIVFSVVAGATFASPASAGEMRSGGKLLLTNGVSTIEGSAGGGLASWAVIAGNETRDGIGATAHLTYVPLNEYTLTSGGVAVGIFDRVELSYARQSFNTRKVGAALGLGRDFKFGQDIFGAKLRLFGDAIYDQDNILPQVSLGVQYKRADKAAIIHAVGGRHANGTDFYVAATKVVLSQSVVLNGTLRWTKANQTGLLGFGGDKHSGRTLQFEGSAGVLLSRNLLVGAEYRTRPDNLGFAKEDDAFDLFAAYAIGRHVTVTAAYADLGAIATIKGQRGLFLSLQTGF
jgi:hypothetical protein